MPLSETKQWIRARVIDYASGLKEDVPLESVLEAVKQAVTTTLLTKEEILKVIDKIEEDPLCLMYITREEKIRKLKQLKDVLSDMEEE